MNNKELKKYYNEIFSALICDRKQKKAFLNDFSANVDEYLTACPEADIDKIKAEFGTPEEIASSFIANSDTIKIKKKLDIKKLILIAVIIVLTIYIAFIIISLIDVHTEAHGYMEEGVVIINTLTGDDAS